jgi:isocitrate dehydrogenase (NAD+)
MSRTLTLVPGDCPELTPPTISLLTQVAGGLRFETPNPGDLEAVVASLRQTGVGLIGWQQGTRDGGQAAPAVALRRALGVYAQERPIRDLAGMTSRFEGVDLVVVRETTEDVYAMLEHETIPGVYESVKVTTRGACERIARHAYELARRTGRQRISIVHKANIMKLADGLFLRACLKVAEDYPELEVDEVIVDALCMKVVLDPTRFDMLVCGNLFGDIVSDLCAGLVGGRSNAPSINHAPDAVMFTAGHGDPPEVAGTGAANPLPLLLPALHMLAHLGLSDESAALRKAIERTLLAGTRPIALGGHSTPEAFCGAVGDALS